MISNLKYPLAAMVYTKVIQGFNLFSGYMGLLLLQIILTLSARGPSLYSESDVCWRHILTYKDNPGAERIKIFQMVMDP